MEIKHRCCHKLQRADAYPDIGEQLDAVMKGFAHLIEQGIPLPEQTQQWVKQCLAVKQNHPKGE